MTDLALRPPPEPSGLAVAVARALAGRSLVLIGMMGAGKSSVGRRLAARMGLPFVDADTEIEAAAGMSIPDIFEVHGEPYFRAGEARVIGRLLADGPRVVATGGGAFMNPGTRGLIAERGLSVWLKAELDVLLRRIRRRSDRPLMQTPDPEATLAKLIAERYPVYAEAALTVQSRDVPHDVIVDEIVATLAAHLKVAPPGTASPPGAPPAGSSPAGPGSGPQAEQGSAS
ncbi:shikimate kinase [Rhodoplanes sp. TEM]|uniref:Shikimate kinase n=1 Tax=Rhodoplanes tepidamans TaxID=200616 RepID=A0ABT5J4J7_RHOTP|nr:MULTISPECIES: shikimate kinase [Rhodoplanes]MDC7784561.1 shikimate kinase [Rhodoplanes tepidamans]MDC7984468.1 shikimate kinase [Rhodoplanes sp. TEM]MDQ0355789.1 shikimate kinase [Rhodoplanes tepidamans]